MFTSDATSTQLAYDCEWTRKPAQATLLRVRDLSVRFPADTEVAVPAIEGISFEIASGEAVGILGESGCGKTTTALALLRLLPPGGLIVRGSILFAGRELLAAGERAASTTQNTGS
jgi:ABC-type glutathione transport system ATPase component